MAPRPRQPPDDGRPPAGALLREPAGRRPPLDTCYFAAFLAELAAKAASFWSLASFSAFSACSCR